IDGPVLQKEPIVIDIQFWTSSHHIIREPPMRCHSPAIEQAGWSEGIHPGTDRRDPANPFRPTRNPLRDEAARLPNTRASATGNDQRVERWRIAQCCVRLKRNSGFSAKRFIRYPNDNDFVTRPSLSVVTFDFRYRKCVRWSDDIERLDSVVTD